MAVTESPVPRLKRIDDLCDQFEQDWLAGRKPSLESYLERMSGPDQALLFRDLLAVELELHRGEQAMPVESKYIRRFPQYSQEILDEFAVKSSVLKPDIEFQAIDDQSTVLPAEQIVMQVIAGPQAGRKFVFNQHDTFLVGRSARAHLQLEGDPHFSRFHFRLEVNPPVCFLMDLGSRNGTFVNGEPVRECHLQGGDIISGGTTEMKIISNSSEQTLLLPPRPRAAAEPIAPAIPRAIPPASAAVTAPLPVIPSSAATGNGVAIPGYELQAEIGHGDLGTVYRAVQLSTRRSVALKVMMPAAEVAEKALQLFLRECSVLSQLDHPHIVKLLDQGTANKSLYVATQYVSTVDLSEQLRQRSLPERVRVCCGLINQVLAALQYAHSRSLVHRDIKPGNVLISRDGKTLSALLSDFGVAKHYTNAGFSQITRAGDVIGSLPYMPPEQFLNSREARPSCDLYAAGATLYHWLTDHTPHDFPPGRSQFLVVLEDVPVPVANRLPNLPPALAALIDRSLSRQPEQRFSSADEMRHALKAALKG